MTEAQICPCGTGRTFGDCCGRYISHSGLPPTAETLMRSRYTAYVLGDKTWLLGSWHASTRPRPQDLRLDPSVKWLDLSVSGTHAGSADNSDGMVEFKVRYKTGGKAYRLHEISRFVKENGQWFYVDGEIQETAW